MLDLNRYIDALIAKDEEAFQIVYDETKVAVFSIIYSVSKSRVVTEDLMQDTYIVMLDKLHLFNRKQKLLPWLLTIARNKAIDYYRKNQKEMLIDITDFDSRSQSDALTGEKRLLIDEALNKLNEMERSVFLLKVVNGLKTKEIAKVLDLPLGTVLWHHRNAKIKLREEEGCE